MGKSADWLDAYNLRGAARVRDALLACLVGAEPLKPGAASSQDGQVDEQRLVPLNLLERARMALVELFPPIEWARGHGWPLRRWANQWWRWDGLKYCPLSEESLKACVRPWLNAFWKEKKSSRVPLNPPEKAVAELVAHLQTDTVVEAEAMPCWLADDFRSDGTPIIDRRPWERVLTSEDAAAEGLPDAKDLVVYPNGVFNWRDFVQGKIRLLERSERLFHATKMPFDFPLEELLQICGDDDAMQEMAAKLSPVFHEFLGIVSGQDPAWEECAAQICGVCQTHITMFEFIGVVPGPPRAGKGTLIRAGIETLVGQENIGIGGFGLLNDRFFAHSLIGKTTLLIPDGEVGRYTDAPAAVEMLKNIRGNDRIYVDRKNVDALPAVRLTCKPIIVCNRMPSLPDPSGALASSFVVLPFDQSFVGSEDPRFKDQAIMDAEVKGRLIWALRGLRILLKRGRFTQPERGQEIIAEYREYSDPLRAFVDECLTRSVDSWTATSELYEVWKKWRAAHGGDSRSQEWFAQQLRASCPWIKRVQQGPKEARKWGYRGLTIVNATPGQHIVQY